jgi:hypothetical protein
LTVAAVAIELCSRRINKPGDSAPIFWTVALPLALDHAAIAHVHEIVCLSIDGYAECENAIRLLA